MIPSAKILHLVALGTTQVVFCSVAAQNFSRSDEDTIIDQSSNTSFAIVVKNGTQWSPPNIGHCGHAPQSDFQSNSRYEKYREKLSSSIIPHGLKAIY